MDGEEVCAGGIATGDDQVGSDVALVAEEVLLEHGHDGDDTWFPPGGQRVEFEVGGDDGGGEFGVGGGAGAGAPDLGGDVVQLLAVLPGGVALVWELEAGTSGAHLVGYDGPGCSSGVCGDDNAAIVQTADDGCSGRCSFGERHALRVEGEVSVVIAEVEARHDG